MSLLEGGMGDLYDAAGRGEIPAPSAAASATPRAAESVPPPAVAEEKAAEADGAEADEPEVAEELFVEETVVVEAVTPAEADGDDAPAESDTEGARLVALNMALNGTSREETDRYLAENFDLTDRDGLLDEVARNRRALRRPRNSARGRRSSGADAPSLLVPAGRRRALFAPAIAPAADAAVPKGFFGVMVSGPLDDARVDPGRPSGADEGLGRAVLACRTGVDRSSRHPGSSPWAATVRGAGRRARGCDVLEYALRAPG